MCERFNLQLMKFDKVFALLSEKTLQILFVALETFVANQKHLRIQASNSIISLSPIWIGFKTRNAFQEVDSFQHKIQNLFHKMNNYLVIILTIGN